jgi:hypothetical protein
MYNLAINDREAIVLMAALQRYRRSRESDGIVFSETHTICANLIERIADASKHQSGSTSELDRKGWNV